MMQDFSMLRDRQGSMQEARQPIVKNQQIDDDHDREKKDDDIDAAVVDALPNNKNVNAKKLIRILRSDGNNVVLWTPQGDVSIRGQCLRGVNIVDLVGDVVPTTACTTTHCITWSNLRQSSYSLGETKWNQSCKGAV